MKRPAAGARFWTGIRRTFTRAQIERENRACRGRILEHEQAAMFLDDGITDREAQSVASRLGREIRIEDFGAQLLGDARAAIGNRDLDVTAARQRRARVLYEYSVARANSNGASLRHGFSCVKHQRIDHLLDLARVDFRLPEIDRDVEVRAQIRSVERELGRMLNQLTHRNYFLQRRAVFGKREQLTGKMRGVLRGLARLREETEETAVIHRRFELGEPDVPGNDGKDVV